MHRLVCRWVPGTFDRVRLQLVDLEQDAIELTVDAAARLLGRRNLDEMYLKGTVRLTVCDDTLKRLSNQEANIPKVILSA
ncbi:hypothetical protein DES52_11544 [Deinococcus yavapaiensis KR-236]|uniref:Uncharacterized protein n=1 Tax=Deinococcus yavapaiensis KR-236 TaxID=694435 RepID=A0A318SIA0_9DEIO|nr:hypothetical protein DES52_11544 [Deinococcus yavapaiensis KR-236]